MPLTTLDAQTALIVVDLQKGLIGSAFVQPIGAVVENAVALLDAFRARQLPVVLVNVAGVAPGRTDQGPRHTGAFPAEFTDFIAELDQQPGDIVITKRSWGAFANTELEQRLLALGVTQVVVTGVATGTGVEATARQAFELGFNVTLAVDAITDGRAGAHDHSIQNIFPRLGETATTADILHFLTTRTA